MKTLRERYIEAGLITPDPYLSVGPLDAALLVELGFHAAGIAAMKAPRHVRAR